MKHLTSSLAVLMLLVSAAALAEGKKTDITLSAGYNYSWGDYGQASNTTVHFAPVTLKVQQEEWTAKLMVPYIRITGPGVVVGDVPVGAPRPVATESGLGDVTASLAWTRVLNGKGTTLELAGIVKLPTADEDRRLGTGLADFTAQAGLIQPVGRAFVLGHAGRKFNGSNGTFPLRDVWKYTLGGGYKIADMTTAGVMYDYRQAQATGGNPLKLATAFISQDLDGGWTAQIYASAGFSNASPNGAVGLQFNKSLQIF